MEPLTKSLYRNRDYFAHSEYRLYIVITVVVIYHDRAFPVNNDQ